MSMRHRGVWETLCKGSTRECAGPCGGTGVLGGSQPGEPCPDCNGAGWTFTPVGQDFREFVASEFAHWRQVKRGPWPA